MRNPRGEPRGFIGATDARRATVHLDLRARHDTLPCHVTGHTHTIPIPSHKSHARRFAFPRRTMTLFPPREHGSQSLSLQPTWGHRSPRAVPTKDGPAKRPGLKGASITRASTRC